MRLVLEVISEACWTKSLDTEARVGGSNVSGAEQVTTGGVAVRSAGACSPGVYRRQSPAASGGPLLEGFHLEFWWPLEEQTMVLRTAH